MHYNIIFIKAMNIITRNKIIKYPKFKELRKLLYPYSSYYSKGIFTNNCERLVLSITKLDGKFKIISYAKYLWEVSHKRKVRKGYEIDHIDGDCTNDTLDNLQEISSTENRKKGTSATVKKNISNKGKVFLWCPVCGIRFKKYKCRIDFKKLHEGKRFFFCSRECAWKAQEKTFVFPNYQKYKKIRQKLIIRKNICVSFSNVSKKTKIKLNYGSQS